MTSHDADDPLIDCDETRRLISNDRDETSRLLSNSASSQNVTEDHIPDLKYDSDDK